MTRWMGALSTLRLERRNGRVGARLWLWLGLAGLGLAGLSCRIQSSHSGHQAEPRVFSVKGLVRDVRVEQQTLVVEHEAIPGFMEAMTMPFRVRVRDELSGLKPGDGITFDLLVTPDESWIERITRIRQPRSSETKAPALSTGTSPATNSVLALLDYPFTNELGQAVTLRHFKGKALAYTFFFTRCPIPEYCPRLTKNFAAASRKLKAMPESPTNWHFLSISIDPDFDTPAVLKTYAQNYQYDPNHWSFLTGPAGQIAALAELSGFAYRKEGAFYTHGFRTVIIDATGRVQMIHPIGGDLSDAIATDMLKAATARP